MTGAYAYISYSDEPLHLFSAIRTRICAGVYAGGLYYYIEAPYVEFVIERAAEAYIKKQAELREEVRTSVTSSSVMSFAMAAWLMDFAKRATAKIRHPRVTT